MDRKPDGRINGRTHNGKDKQRGRWMDERADKGTGWQTDEEMFMEFNFICNVFIFMSLVEEHLKNSK